MSNLSTGTPDNTTSLCRGRKIFCGLYGGTYKIITKFIPSKDRVQSIGNGCIVTGGGQVHYVQIGDCIRLASVPEAIVRGVQWDILDEIIPEAEVQALEEKARNNENAAYRAAMEKQATMDATRAKGEKILAEKRPAWAKAAIVACYRRDESDLYSDYHGSCTTKEIIIGWSKHTRDLFPEMRKAAAASGLEFLQHLATAPTVNGNGEEKTERNKSWWHPADEHREKYSMGGGFYLKDGWRHSDGWHIHKSPHLASLASVAGEPGGYAVPDPAVKKSRPAKQEQPAEQPAAAAAGEVATVRLNQEKNGVELVFSCKPSAKVRDSLKANRWRWHRKNGCWYTRDTPENRAFAATIAGIEEKNNVPAAEKQEGQPAEQPAADSRDLKKAERFRQLARNMENEIDNKLNPGVAQQNPTPRRIAIAASMRSEGERLQMVQSYLVAIADHLQAGTLPDALQHLNSKSAINEARRTTPRLFDCLQIKKAAADPRAEIKRMENELVGTKIPGFFPTPAPLAEKLVELAEIEAGHTILEPSAGNGNIADAITENHRENQLDVIERSATLRDILTAKDYTLAGSDFLDHTGKYDRIIMNPPFEKGQDMDHIRHAFSMLKPGGRVVSIICEGVFFRSDKKTKDFRAWMQQNESHSEKLPDGSFTGPGCLIQTGVAARVIVLDKLPPFM